MADEKRRERGVIGRRGEREGGEKRWTVEERLGRGEMRPDSRIHRIIHSAEHSRLAL
jgi:hypothetical protein